MPGIGTSGMRGSLRISVRGAGCTSDGESKSRDKLGGAARVVEGAAGISPRGLESLCMVGRRTAVPP